MRQRIKTSLSFALLLCCSLLLTLAACGGTAELSAAAPPAQDSAPPAQSPPEAQVQPPAVSPSPSDHQAPPTASPQPQVSPQPEDMPDAPAPTDPPPQISQPVQEEQPPSMRDAYRAALEAIYTDHVYPDGREVATGELFDMEENQFALYDVDGDGEEELIYANTSSYMAGMTAIVYGFDSASGHLYQELEAFPAMTFYDNGIITSMASHNQGLAGEFWPYTLYQYDWGADTYVMAGSVDAWDGSIFPKDYEDVPFPDDVDLDGDQMIFYIVFGGQEVIRTPVDGAEYLAWLDSYLEGAQEVTLPYLKLTWENIQSV